MLFIVNKCIKNEEIRTRSIRAYFHIIEQYRPVLNSSYHRLQDAHLYHICTYGLISQWKLVKLSPIVRIPL